MREYQELLARKRVAFNPSGLRRVPSLNAAMFPHQAHSTEFALRAGCAALFLDTGLGKSLCALDWGRIVVEKTNKPVLMLAPLAVGPQHQREAEKFGIEAKYIREAQEITGPGIWITNYERMELFDTTAFAGIILDESSILKAMQGKTSRALIAAFADTPYRLACTATPAPNDHTELGNHAEFLGIMNSNEMLSRWFINDTSTASQSWRLKGHAVGSYWDWVASWARCVAKPSDLGFSDDGFILPQLVTEHHVVDADRSVDAGEDGNQARLFRMPENSATSIHKEKRLTVDKRATAIAAAVAGEPTEPWVVWCNTDNEADALLRRIDGAIEVRGSMPPEKKEERLVAFSTGKQRILITKPSIAGYGLNWQHCARMAFVGLDFSFEGYYQAVRRCWRFGQARPVHVHVAMADTERNIFESIARKSMGHDKMRTQMAEAMRRAYHRAETRVAYNPTMNVRVPAWLRA